MSSQPFSHTSVPIPVVEESSAAKEAKGRGDTNPGIYSMASTHEINPPNTGAERSTAKERELVAKASKSEGK